ncbi:metal ABC transporter permease [Akkermansiaceae bacterium]|nr:metal ABC transporter permease [Akkermansiaceae bacterium]
MFTLLLNLGIIEKALITAAFLGILCGMFGTFIVLRKISLVGDAVSHALLPGIVLGFIFSTMLGYDREPLIILLCALAVGLLAIWLMKKLESTTRIKSDAALGIVLSGFFGLGLFMKSSLKEFMSFAGGIESYLFGNIATISNGDFYTLMITGVILIGVTFLFLRPLVLVSFDEQFTSGIGFPKTLLHLLFYGILTMTIVVSVQAVGVILVSALLIIPASTAFLLTDRKSTMLWLAMAFGAAAGLAGALVSIYVKGVNVPSGAAMTLASASLFFTAYFFAPKYGVLAKFINHRNTAREIAIDNSLKWIFKNNEPCGDIMAALTNEEFSTQYNSPTHCSKAHLKLLQSKGYITLSNKLDLQEIQLTQKGQNRGAKIVRNHRIWELYLAQQADYRPDHVHDDAEIMEHIIDEATVERIAAELGHPETDPHGMPIPMASHLPTDPSNSSTPNPVN